MGDGRNFVYILSEDGSFIGETFKEAATHFAGIHKDDAVIRVFVRQSEPTKFENARKAFEIRRIPAFVVSEEDHKFNQPELVNRYIAFDRGVLERYVVKVDATAKKDATKEAFYNLLSDFNYVIQDEGLLRLKQSLISQRIVSILKIGWEELKDLVSISVSPSK